MENRKCGDSEQGTLKGNGVPHVLENIYLHYVLDYWIAVKIKR